MLATYKNKNKNGVDKRSNGKFRDNRKAKVYYIPETKLVQKTELEGLQKTIFIDRYSLKDGEGNAMERYPEQMWHRVAEGIAQFEKTPNLRKKWKKKFYDAMEGFRFVPAGRILSGAGTGYEVTFFNCYVIPTPSDSREGIMESVTQTVEIQARAGGVGLNLSSLRPRGARVKKVNGTSSGPVNWASLYSTANHDVIQQGGSRRGALMLMLHDWHPDIEEFIKVKEDLTKIPGANLSVCVSDGFMDAVKKDRKWDLKFADLDDPEYDEKWDGDINEWERMGKKVKVYESVRARDIWDMIATAAWRSAEPGLHFLERSNKRSNTHYFEKLLATNPCVIGQTKISTQEGLVEMRDIVDSHKKGGSRYGGNMGMFVDQRTLGNGRTGVLESSAVKFYDVGPKEVWKLKTKSGFELVATGDHKILTTNGWVELCELGRDDTVLLQSGKGSFGNSKNLPFTPSEPTFPGEWSLELGHALGWLVGDGWLRSGDKNCRVGFTFGKDSKKQLAYFKRIINGWYGKNIKPVKRERDVYHLSYHSKGFVDFFEKLGVGGVKSEEKQIPESLYMAPEEAVVGFLQALFGADGTVRDSKKSNSDWIALTSKSKELLQGVQLLLLNLGIKGRIFDRSRRERKGMFPYVSKSGEQRSYTTDGVLYELGIFGQFREEFQKRIGFLDERKQEKLENMSRGIKNRIKDHFTDTVVSVRKAGRRRVYDLTEPMSHTMIANGLVVHQCGEQPLGAWSVCNLGSMNLSAYVDERGEFDYKALERDSRVAMRFMDNVVDANFYFYEENRREQMNIRRTGLGTMGLADALIKMRIPYGSPESIGVIEKIYKTIRDSAYDTSADLAVEKGPFPKFEKASYMKGWFIKRLPEDIQKKIAKQSIRNAVLLTQAPTGTTSLLAGTSSGIEPVYDFEFKRTDRTGEHVIYHPLYRDWKDAHPGEPKPDYFVSAMSLTPREHLAVQAKVQEYNDSAISKTVNAPESYSIEDVKNLYTEAYEKGLKGITFFRDGSRAGVLSSVEDKKEKNGEVKVTFDDANPLIDRPLVVKGSTYKMRTPVGSAFITINETEEGEPFEVFINIGKAGSDVSAMAAALGRTISAALRFKGNVSARARAREIINQLSGIGGRRSVGFGAGKIRSLPEAVAMSLAVHFKLQVSGGNGDMLAGENTQEQLSLSTAAGEPEVRGDICPECGASTLVFEEGCAKCYSCGHSEC